MGARLADTPANRAVLDLVELLNRVESSKGADFVHVRNRLASGLHHEPSAMAEAMLRLQEQLGDHPYLSQAIGDFLQAAGQIEGAREIYGASVRPPVDAFLKAASAAVHLMTMPRSGTHYLIHMLVNYFANRARDAFERQPFNEIPNLMAWIDEILLYGKPFADVVPSRKDVLPIPNHSYLFRYHNPSYLCRVDAPIVFLYRNALDSVISQDIFFNVDRGKSRFRSFEEYVFDFEAAKKYLTIYLYNYRAMSAIRDAGARVLFVRYEDLVGAPEETLAQVLRHTGEDPNEALVARAVEASGADQLREEERLLGGLPGLKTEMLPLRKSWINTPVPGAGATKIDDETRELFKLELRRAGLDPSLFLT